MSITTATCAPPSTPLQTFTPAIRYHATRGGVSAPWESIGDRFEEALMRPGHRSWDNDEVRDANCNIIEGKSAESNLAAGFVTVLFSPLMLFVGLYKFAAGHPLDGLFTTLFGPLFDAVSGLKDLFYDAPKHFLNWLTAK
jgi:hypothetical protein